MVCECVAGGGLVVGCECGQDVGYVGVCSSRAVRSSIIVFDAYEVATKGLPPCRRHGAKYTRSYLSISIQEVVSRDTRLCVNRSQC